MFIELLKSTQNEEVVQVLPFVKSVIGKELSVFL